MKKRPDRGPDPGEADLPEGWRSLSWASRRELMRGTRIPLPGEGFTRGDFAELEVREFASVVNRVARDVYTQVRAEPAPGRLSLVP